MPVSRVLVLGGQRSGKSRYAEALVLANGCAPVYLATATPGDGEMAERIARHRAWRGGGWRTVEEPLDLPGALLREAHSDAVVLVERDEADAVTPPLAPGVPTYRMHLDAVALVESVERRWRERPIGQLAARRVVAVTGVARPQGFYALLRRWEAVIDEVFEYPDHHAYTREDWQQIARRGHNADLIVTTEKDLVKLEAFPFATGKLVALRIAPRVERAEELVAAILATTGLPAHPGEENRNGHQ